MKQVLNVLKTRGFIIGAVAVAIISSAAVIINKNKGEIVEVVEAETIED